MLIRSIMAGSAVLLFSFSAAADCLTDCHRFYGNEFRSAIEQRACNTGCGFGCGMP